MSNEPLVKIGAATAAEICAHLTLLKEVKQLLRDGMNPQDFLAALIEKKKYVDAIHFMAHALPMREGIWWGCLCLQHACGDGLNPPDRAAATAAVQWVMQPTEENRTAAKAPADAAPPPSVAGALAMATFQTGGSILPPNLPPTPPAPFAAAKAIALAVTLASIKTEPPKIARMQRSYVELAVEIAEGRPI
jgi:hypothetical protein